MGTSAANRTHAPRLWSTNENKISRIECMIEIHTKTTATAVDALFIYQAHRITLRVRVCLCLSAIADRYIGRHYDIQIVQWQTPVSETRVCQWKSSTYWYRYSEYSMGDDIWCIVAMPSEAKRNIQSQDMCTSMSREQRIHKSRETVAVIARSHRHR